MQGMVMTLVCWDLENSDKGQLLPSLMGDLGQEGTRHESKSLQSYFECYQNQGWGSGSLWVGNWANVGWFGCSQVHRKRPAESAATAAVPPG